MDMNAFFAAVEQRDFPALRGRPVAVTNGARGTCIITCSYEARAFGIHTGMRLREARRLCPALVQCPARPRIYAAVSAAIMTALRDRVSPDMEVFSVDEAFLDVTRCQRLHGTPLRMARMVKAIVAEVSGGLRCSVGVSGDKTTAKFAAKLVKPDGLTVIPPWEARERLAEVPVTALCGVAEGIGRFLAQHGAHTCGDVARLPVSVLARRFGNLGRRIWLMCQGRDPDRIHVDAPPPRTLGHGKVVPPATTDRELLLTYLQHMSEKVAARLRRHRLEASAFFVGLKLEAAWLGQRLHTAVPVSDGGAIFRLCRRFVAACWQGEGVFQVQVTALAPRPCRQQLLLFDEGSGSGETAGVDTVMDEINRCYGELTIAPARLLQRSTMPDVIAPAWKPTGHRRSV
ncbi:MAG TPA: DNA polymerase IV [Gammaproteobacteria bacterium]|nr:DNA polymerase IV [Gammaproteobacteria bacterium]